MIIHLMMQINLLLLIIVMYGSSYIVRSYNSRIHCIRPVVTLYSTSISSSSSVRDTKDSSRPSSSRPSPSRPSSSSSRGKQDYRKRDDNGRGRSSSSSSSSSSRGKQDYRKRDDNNDAKNVTSYVYNKGDGKTVVLQASAVKNIYGEPQEGDFVEVRDHRGNPIGRGFYNPHSQYRIRILTRSTESNYDNSIDDILSDRIITAAKVRKSINIPSDSVDVYRLINGEGDRLGGLIVDVIGTYIVIQSSALWVETYKRIINDCIEKHIPLIVGQGKGKIIWRRVESRLIADGYGSSSSTNDDDEDDDDNDGVNEIDDDDDDNNDNNDDVGIAEAESIIVKENNIKYMVFPTLGQKTGFYCDQRDNRNMLKGLCNDKEVLDCYCYSGGFALAALLGGAKKVIAVDSSAPAIELAAQNMKLNGVEDRATLIKADAVDYMRKALDEGQSFDVVIADPPKLAPSRASLYKAKNKYIKINAAAMKLCKPGGLLLTCSCSAAVTQSGEFVSFLLEASKIAKRDITILSVTGAASDHTVHAAYPEGRYLTGVLCSVA